MYNQLSLLGEKLSAQTTYIETLKAKLEDKEQKLTLVEGERTKLEENLLKLSLSHEELQVIAGPGEKLPLVRLIATRCKPRLAREA